MIFLICSIIISLLLGLICLLDLVSACTENEHREIRGLELPVVPGIHWGSGSIPSKWDKDTAPW